LHPKLRFEIALYMAVKPLSLFLFLGWATLIMAADVGLSDLAVKERVVEPLSAGSAVPAVTAQGRSLAPQAVAAVDISADGRCITVGTMAFSHEPNVWQFGNDGAVLEKRHLPPWAPLQVASFAGGQITAVGMAMSRFTGPEPNVWCAATGRLFGEPLQDADNRADSQEGQFSRWRFGEGDWQNGWLVSSFGELFVHGADWLFQPPNIFVGADGKRQTLRYEDGNLLPTHRAARMAVSADGKQLAFGWLCPDEPAQGLPMEKNLVSVWSVQPNHSLWTAAPSEDVAPPPLPDPARDFSALQTQGFRLGADKLVKGSIATALAINHDGSRVALIEYRVWTWLRIGPAIGKWDPPVHALQFIPNQSGRLRIFDGQGKELLRVKMPATGLFELGFGPDPDEVLCWPSSWMARGMAGEPWLPVQGKARALYRIHLGAHEADALEFPDAIADCAIHPGDGRALVSCWNGMLYCETPKGSGESPQGSGESPPGAAPAKIFLGAPARLAWSADGTYAVAGTSKGELCRVEKDGSLGWKKPIPVADPPDPVTRPAEVVPGIPVYQGGRCGPEHAYVGDIWVLKLGREGLIVDSGGTSAFATSQARVKALGIEKVTHVLHTHSHGDHCGSAYLWRCLGAQIVAPRSGALTQIWLMPMLTDYGVFPPRPIDVPLPLNRVGDETDFTVSGQKFHALFVPGHSFDLTIYMTELGGKRVAFTGDLGFKTNLTITHRCWGDAEKARPVVQAVREKLLPWQPDVVFTGHGVRRFGRVWLEDLLRRSEEELAEP
jgi:glyoxylase-like metal-dependent hydrolase (beta-lactamase superfamily II)